MSESTDPLISLVGRELAAVTFVRDYIQISFDGPYLTAVVDPVLHVDNKTYHRGEHDYNNVLIAFINRSVTRVTVEDGREIVLVFEDNSNIILSLRREDLQFGPEAVIFNTPQGSWTIFPGADNIRSEGTGRR